MGVLYEDSLASGFGKEQTKGIEKREAKNEVHKDF